MRRYITDKQHERARNGVIDTYPVIDLALPHACNGVRPNHVVAYRRTGCFTKERMAELPPRTMTVLCREFGFCLVWKVPDKLITVSRGVYECFGKYLPYDCAESR